jgi:hypothetical protein
MLAGLQQLTQPADPAVAEMPRMLLVLAAGVTEQQVDVAALQRVFSQARAAERPISLVIVGFGSDFTGEFSSLPANPDGLATLARVLGGQYIAMGSGLPDVRAKQRLTSQLTALLQQGEQFQLQGTVQRAQAGDGTLTVEVGPLQVSRQVIIPTRPTSFIVAADTSNPAQARFSIATQFEQTPIQTVEYALNGTTLEQRGISGPNFDLPVNTSAAWFQQRYPPGSYQLSATAFDAAGQPITNSTNTVNITIAPPPVGTSAFDVLSAMWLLALLLLGVVGVGGWFAVQRFRSG